MSELSKLSFQYAFLISFLFACFVGLGISFCWWFFPPPASVWLGFWGGFEVLGFFFWVGWFLFGWFCFYKGEKKPK